MVAVSSRISAALRANALLQVDADVGQATAGRTPELRLERDLAVGADTNPGTGVGHAVAVEVEGDQAVEALTGIDKCTTYTYAQGEVYGVHPTCLRRPAVRGETR
jgi:hypothetical protein